MKNLLGYLFGWMLTRPRSGVRAKVRAAMTLRQAKLYGIHPSMQSRLDQFRNAEGYSFPQLEDAA